MTRTVEERLHLVSDTVQRLADLCDVQVASAERRDTDLSTGAWTVLARVCAETVVDVHAVRRMRPVEMLHAVAPGRTAARTRRARVGGP